MAFLDRLVHRPTQASKACEHFELVPEFERPADAGDEANASLYRCAGCGHVFEPGEAFLMRMKRRAAGAPAVSNN